MSEIKSKADALADSLLNSGGVPNDPPPSDPPPSDPPPSDPPPNDPPPSDPPPSDPPEVLKYSLEELGWGNGMTKVEFDAIGVHDKLSNFGKYEEENNLLKGKLNDTQTPWANNEIATYNQFLKDGGVGDYDAFSRLNNIDLEQLKTNPIEAIAAQMIQANPSLLSRKSALVESLQKQYGVNKEKWEDEDSEYRPVMDEFALSNEGMKAVKALEEEKNKIKEYKSPEDNLSDEVLQQREASNALREGWGNITERLSNEMRTVSFDDNFKMNISNDFIKTHKDKIVNFAVANNFKMDEASLSQVNTFIQGLCFHLDRSNLLNQYKTQVETNLRKTIDAEQNGAPPVETPQGGKTGGGNTSKADELAQIIMSGG